jgi:predicted  nucleic acid-binding Zn-ribbon protein
MNAVSKVLIVLVFVMAVGFAVSEMILFSKRENFGNLYKDASTRLKTANDELSKARAEATDLDTRLQKTEANLTAKLDASQEKLAAAQADVERLGALNREQVDMNKVLAASNNDLSQRNVTLGNTIDQQKATIDQRTQTVQEHLDSIKQLETTVADRNGSIDDLQFNLTETQKVLNTTKLHNDELLSIIGELRKNGVHIPPTPLPIINARVVRVDAQHGVAVVDKGRTAGVTENTQFTIYDDQGYVGKLIIDSVDPEVSAGRIQLLREGAQVKQGNQATTEIP